MTKPDSTEYAPYFEKYISLAREEEIVATLGRQIEGTLSLIRGLSAAQGDLRYAPGKWSVKEVIGHLIDTERIFAYRAMRFARNDATPLPGFDENLFVANAGFGYRLSVVEGDITRWKDMIDTNVYGLLLTLKYGVPPLLERGEGHVIVTSSVAGRVPTPGGAAYCGTKAAATAIADSVRQEVGPKGVRVTAIEPGVVISEFQQVAQYPPEILPNMLKGAVPLAPIDIARAVIFVLEQPAHVGFNEILVRPTGQAYP